jgi:hypothetical protein
MPDSCPRCGQSVIGHSDSVCMKCRAVDREPQGETVRLFEPAPNQLPGQLTIG